MLPLLAVRQNYSYPLAESRPFWKFFALPLTMISVVVRAYELEVEVSSSESFPDHVDDLCNRAAKLFKESVEIMRVSEIPLGGADEID